MHMFALGLHIFVAFVMSLAIIGVFIAAYKQRETRAYVPMMVSFSATVVSGIGLLFITPTGLGRLCAMMSAFTILVLVARYYYSKRSLQPAT